MRSTPPAAPEPGFPGMVSISLLTADCLFQNNSKVNNVGTHESRGWGTPERDAERVTSCDVVREPGIAKTASDHYPIMVRCRV